MPYRRYPIVLGEIYHVFNRSIARQPIFLNQRDCQRALDVLYFYSFEKPGLRFSHYNRLSQEEKSKFLDNLKITKNKQIQLLAFCLMPNHIHLLVKGLQQRGIAIFMANFQHSYAKYFNTKNKRTGSVFQSMFKAVRIETDEQLLHVVRYIHINPLTSYVVKDTSNLEDYLWSSYPDYVGRRQLNFVDPKLVLESFASTDSFKQFTLNQVDYQRKLEEIKHLILE
ncbi:transposase [Candidatus Gottesmanbacteria bacterium]|nr:transposase [Candidatus Gottesmanbacteria bacterium]